MALRAGLAWAFVGVFMISATAHADEPSPCVLRAPADVLSAPWAEAVRDASALVATLTTTTTDCRRVVVTPDAEGATVEFTTADGRGARRRIGGPRELVPAVAALLVFEAPATEPPPAVEPPVEAAASTPELAPVEAAPPPDLAQPSPAKKDRALLVGAVGGVKGGFPHDTVTPVAEVFVGVTLEQWELAAFGRVEIEHDAESSADANAPAGKLRYSAVGGGAMFGRRVSLGPVVLFGGARAALYGAEEERTGQKSAHREGRREDELLDPRAGLYAGGVFAASTRYRVRVQIDGDAGLVAHAATTDMPAFPRWGLGLTVGMEAAFLQ